jgi:hypothetical protein
MSFPSKFKFFHGIISGGHLLKDLGINLPLSFVNPFFLILITKEFWESLK